MAKFKNFRLRDSNQVDSMQQMYWHYTNANVMCNQWRMNLDNYVWYENNTSALGNSILTDTYAVDEDLIISVGYNDGFVIRRMLDDGSMVIIYSDSSPTAGTGGNNFAISKTHHKAFVSYYSRSGTEVYDYSGCLDGGTDTVIQEGVFTTSNSNIPTNQAGFSFANGFVVAGNYLYMGHYLTSATMSRWEFIADTNASLTVTNLSANGYRGKLFYHEASDRVFANWYYNGELWVTDSASTSGAECFQVDLGGIYASNDTRSYMSSVMKDNENHIWQMNYYGSSALIDITTPLGGSSASPTEIFQNSYSGNRYNAYYPYNIRYVTSIFNHPTLESDLILISAYSSTYSIIGWFDQEHGMPVGIPYNLIRNLKTGAYEYHVEDNNNTQLNYSHAPGMSLPVTSSGTSQTYWFHCGYSGTNGYNFRTWGADTSGFTFFDSGQTIFGDFELDDSSFIRSIKVDIPLDNVYILFDTNINCYVSNDAGVSWEFYNYSGATMDDLHVFNSYGTAAQVKLVFNGTNTKSPHISGMNYISVAIQGDDKGAIAPRRIARLKIKGKV